MTLTLKQIPEFLKRSTGSSKSVGGKRKKTKPQINANDTDSQQPKVKTVRFETNHDHQFLTDSDPLHPRQSVASLSLSRMASAILPRVMFTML
jgi:hypothetical protein